MKIGIYARGLSGIGGVKQYIESMCRAMIDALFEDDELFIFHNLEAPYFNATRPNVTEVLLRSRNRFKCDLIEAPKVINQYKPDVVWFTKYVVPFGLETKTVTTVHDMAYYLPDLGAYATLDTFYMRVMIRNSCYRADHIVAVSKHTKQDIMKFLGTKAEKISVIQEAADARYQQITDKDHLDNWRRKWRLTEPFILFTGGISPRKNLKRLIEAYTLASSQIPHKLVLTGGKGWKNKKILDVIENHPGINRLGFVPDDEMSYLYSAADLFVYPSLYEGFGLPIIEAQRCGCPVVSSQTSSLKEVGEDSVVPIDPLNKEALSRAIVSTLQDEARIADLRRRGFENADRFSWERAANDLMRILKQCE